jgi:hypothetical protein
MGAERKSQFIDPKNKLATAYHEVYLMNVIRLISKELISHNHRADMLSSPCTPMVLCLFTK